LRQPAAMLVCGAAPARQVVAGHGPPVDLYADLYANLCVFFPDRVVDGAKPLGHTR